MEFVVGPKIVTFQRFKEFADQYQLGAEDIIVTNEMIAGPILELGLDCQIIYQEQFGGGEPSDLIFDRLRALVPASCKRIIAVGGGSVMDCAKLMSYGGDFRTAELFDGTLQPTKVKTLLAVPTTCGTGSEVTNLISVALSGKHIKKGIGFPDMYPDVAVLIPELMESLPYKVFATSSMDALVHAVESYLSPKASALSRMFSVDAIKRILSGYQAIVSEGDDARRARSEDFLLASTNAGIAFSNAGCAAVHALSYPLGGEWKIPHGEANQIMFMAVLHKYKAIRPAGAINAFEELLAGCLGCDPGQALDELDRLTSSILAVKPLHEYGVKVEDLPRMAEGVKEGQQRLLQNNYVPLSVEEMIEIYQVVY